jgi:phage-related protein
VQEFIQRQALPVQSKILASLKFLSETRQQPSGQLFKKLSGASDLWEVRIKHDKNIYRILRFHDEGRLVVLTHAFQKKTQKTPLTELNTAKTRRENYLKRKKT